MSKDIPQILENNRRTTVLIREYQAAPSEDRLYRILTEITKTALHDGMWMAAVNPAKGSKQLYLTLSTDDGRKWYPVFTDVKEGSHDSGLSIINAGISDFIDVVMEDQNCDGILINPWSESMPLDRKMLRVIQRTLRDASNQ